MCLSLKFNNPFLFLFLLHILIISSYNAHCKNIEVKNYFLAISDTSKLKEINIEEVVISGQISPKKIGDAVQDVQIINRQKINKLGSNTLNNLLSQQNNTRLSNDNILGSNVSIQGLSGQNIKILVDGIPVIGRLNGNIDLSQINLNYIEKVEIIEGPMSVNYGSDALAGTINLISYKSQNNKTEINSYYESVGHYNIDFLQRFTIKPHSISFSAGRNYFNGWSKGENLRIFPIKTMANETRYKEWKPKEQFFYQGTYRYHKTNIEISSNYSGFYEQIINRGFPREPLLNNAFDDYYTTLRNTFSTTANYYTNQTKTNIIISHANYKRTKNTYFKDLTNLNQVLSSNTTAHDTSKFINSIVKATFKFPTQKQFEKEVGVDLNFESAEGKRIESKTQSIIDYAIFSNMEWKYKENLVVRPGLRYAYNTNYKAPLIPSIHLKYKLKNSIIRSSFAKGFRAPSLKEQYFNFVDINHNIVGNENLKAETSNNFQISYNFKKRFENSSIFGQKISLFYNELSQKITLANVSNQAYKYINVGEFKSKGIGTTLTYMTNTYSINYSFSYLGRYNQLSEDKQTYRFAYSNDHSFSMTKKFDKIKTSVSLFCKRNGKLPSYRLDGDGQVQNSVINEYSIMDLTINKLIKNTLNLTFGFKNILDVQSINGINLSSGTHQSSQNSLSVAYGRSFFISLKYKMK